MSEFYAEIASKGLTRDVLEKSIDSPLHQHLKKMWTDQLEVLQKGLELAKTYEDLKFKLGQISNLRYNLNQLIMMEQIIYPPVQEEVQ
jgi:hypothetical protein